MLTLDSSATNVDIDHDIEQYDTETEEKNNDTGYPCIWINGTPHVLDTGGDFEVGGIFIR